jgi:hypothetical protein
MTAAELLTREKVAANAESSRLCQQDQQISMPRAFAAAFSALTLFCGGH